MWIITPSWLGYHIFAHISFLSNGIVAYECVSVGIYLLTYPNDIQVGSLTSKLWQHWSGGELGANFYGLKKFKDLKNAFIFTEIIMYCA